MTSKQRLKFRQSYENNISTKLEIDKEQFYRDYYETKQPLILSIFGILMFLYGLYILFEINTIYGILIILISLFPVYRGFKRNKIVFRISKKGIWTAEFGFIYFRHIDRFEFQLHTGKFSSERIKIYMKNYKAYHMEMPFLEQHISHIDNCSELKTLITKDLQSQKMNG
ncbi:hypothetical protein [Pedobacter caeni]|uniref:Uncharacterized protein n=1 Tax=Pedobacter caeni TaxID=288992 RepID=A0A1M4SY36_9SPHI|nr:hypothetical protein [Pedobacter caeni]SHE37138.1 hypothetical protein SAMN04488522_10111 [Pedobacter caeni]